MEQLHKRFTDEQVKGLLKRYLKRVIKRTIEAYRKITIKNLSLWVNGNPHDDV